MSNILKNSYIYKAVEPDLPAPSQYLDLLNEMHHKKLYTNFGPLNDRLADLALEIFGAADEVCVPCCSATAGLSAALLHCPVDRPVLVPAFTFPATFGAVKAAGRIPLVMDVSVSSWSIDANALDDALRLTSAGAVVLVAPFGIRTDFSDHVAVCRRHGALVVIDCAAGLGVKRQNFCTAPDVFEVFSLHATKPLGVGEGGLVFAHSSRKESLRSALNFALTNQTSANPDLAWGFNGKLSEIHAAIGIVQFGRYLPMVAERQAYVELLVTALVDIPQLLVPRNSKCAPWQMFPVLLPSRFHAERLIAAGAAAGMEMRRYYRPSLSQWPNLRCIDACTVSEMLADRMIALPVRRLDADGKARELLDLTLATLRQALA